MEDEAVVVYEWEDERESGTLGFRLVDGGPDHGIWLEARVREQGEEWNEWAEEDLDGPGLDLLTELPSILAAERARIRRELLAVEQEIMWGAHPKALREALDRICPEEG